MHTNPLQSSEFHPEVSPLLVLSVGAPFSKLTGPPHLSHWPPHNAKPAMEPVHTPTHWSFSLDIHDCAASTETQIGPLVGTAASSKPWLVAFDGQDSFAYARAAAAQSAEGKNGG